MTLINIIDIKKLLQPVSVENPAGAKLELDSSQRYRDLKNAREEARRAEKKQDTGVLDGKEITKIKKKIRENWLKVFQLAQYILQHKSKNIVVTVWLLEALVRLHAFHNDYPERSFAGLSEGFLLTHGLFENFWKELQQYDGQTEQETNLKLINGLNAESGLVKAIRMVPITAGEVPFATWQWKNITEGGDEKDYEKLARSAKETSSDFYSFLINDLRQCLTEFDNFTHFMSEKVGSGNLHSSNIRQVLKDVQRASMHVCKEIAGKELEVLLDKNEHGNEQQASEASSNQENYESKVSEMPSKPSSVETGHIQNREDAFRKLLEIASYFEKNEPHSPISYTLKEVVRRGRLSLVELLGELVEQDSRTMFLERAGIRPPKQEDE